MSKSKLLLFLYAATTRVFINLVGRLMLAEIIAVISLPLINIRKLLHEHRKLKIVFIGLSALLATQIVSDFFNNSSPSDYLRGWAVIIFAMISTIYLVNHLSKNINNIVYYLFALFIVQLLFSEGSIDISFMGDNTNYFKQRFVGFLNALVLVTSFYVFKKNKKALTFLVLITYGFICMILDARSNGLIFIIAAILLYVKMRGIAFSKSKLIVLSFLISGILYVGYIFYVNQVLYHGIGGSNAQTQLRKTSNPYNPFELLYYGRMEFAVLFQAGLDKPIFGYGSWGKDPDGKYAKLIALIAGSNNIGDEGYIKAHSILLGYWAYAGIGGLLAISYVFFKLFSLNIRMYRSKIISDIYPILLVLTIDMLWHFLFSPIGHLRTTFPLFASITIIEYTNYQKLLKS